MAGRQVPLVIILCIFLLCFKEATAISGAEVTNMNPRQGSLNGGTRVTIQGKGFAENQFNFGDGNSHLGNRVVMVSGTKDYECDIHLDGCHETQLMCYTRPMPDGYYFIKVFVDGKQLPDAEMCKRSKNNCRFNVRNQNTPRILNLEPKSGIPRQLLTMRTKMFTNLYETNNEQSTNGKDNIRITRVWAHGQKCELRKPDSDEYYKLELDNDGRSDFGNMICLNEGTYVGNLNISFLINNMYGRSNPDNNVLQVTGGLEIGMHQTYAEISGISPIVGSIKGSAKVTISGDNFDETDSPAEILVGGVPCAKVHSVENNNIVCETPAPADNDYSHYFGNRGLDIEIWNDTASVDIAKDNLMNASYLSNPTGGHVHIDDFSFSDSTIHKFVARSRGYFVAPSDSGYTFFIKCDDKAMLLFSEADDPDQKRKIAECPGPATNYNQFAEQESEVLTLEKGKRYYLEGLLLDAGGPGRITVAVRMHKTNYLSSNAGNVNNEVQIIAASSVVINEKQTIKLNSMATKSKVDEVQEFSVSDPSGTGTFRLGMNGVFTSSLNTLATASQVRSALNMLPSIAPETVTVTSTEIKDGRKFTVTFSSERGDWDDLEFMQDSGSNVSYSFEEVTKGQPSGKVWVAGFDGRLTSALSSTISANELKKGLEEMLGSRCPSKIVRPSGRAFFNDYEKDNGWNIGGDRVNDVESFCGRYSVKNPGYLFLKGKKEPSVNIAGSPILCFSYMGDLQERIYVKYLASEVDVEDPVMRQDTFNGIPLVPSTESWSYICVDIWSLVKTRRPQVTRAIIDQITVWRKDGAEDMWIDVVFMGSRVTTTDYTGLVQYERLVPKTWLLKDITVTGDATDGYDVTMETLNCDNNLPLFHIGHAGVQAGSTPDQAVYRGNNWPEGASVTVTRQAAASPPVGGQFSLIYGNQILSGLSPDIKAEDMSEELGSLRGAGSVTVKRTGTCAGYTWEAEFATRGGDHPQLVVDQSDVTGNEVTMTTSTKTEGGVFFDPIRGDMLRTYHTTPQITVKINDIPSICSGDCSYRWAAEATPTVTEINPTQGSQVGGTILTVTGSGFGDEANVTIGGVACDVTSVIDTQILCNIGEGPAGSHVVEVIVKDKGLADHQDQDKTFTYEFSISGINPQSGSTAGGTKLEIAGTGFGPNLAVSLGDNRCSVTNSSYTSITCTTPEGTGSVTVTVTDGTRNGSYDSFTFAAPAAVVSSISSTIGKVDGSQTLTISGTNFGSTAPYNDAVTLGGVRCNITSWTDTSIVVTLPPLPQGSYPLHVLPDLQGYADTTTNSIADVTYAFKVTSVSPAFGSLQGGTTLTLTGEGFSSTTESNEVRIGNVPCSVTSSSQIELECVIANPGTVHNITNQGSHPVYGAGYAWSERSLDVEVGDFVQWQWSTPNLVQNVGYKVEQVDSATSVTPTENGFSSGQQSTRNGKFYHSSQCVFTYQFTTVGPVHYQSGPVDGNGIINMRGVINVGAKASFAEKTTMKIGNIEAQYLQNQGTKRRKRSAACPEISEPVPGCSGTPPSDGNAIFSYGFWDCSTPSISSITPNNGTTLTDITIVGTGFGEQNCQNTISVGSSACTVISSSANSVTCRINSDTEAMIGRLQDVTMTVSGRGSAINTIQSNRDRMFQLMPSVTGVSPAEGSTEGGTLVTLTGSGFSGHANTTIIAMGTATCAVQSLSYTQIICKTTSALVAGNVNVQVMVGVAGGAFVAECEGACSFEFGVTQTPAATGYNPTSISEGNSILTITGTDLGQSVNDITVLIGTTSCTPLTASDTEITCNVGQPLVGSQLVTLRRENWGYAKLASSSINVNAIINSISPTSGSTAGGTQLTISGVGFKEDDTSVIIGGNSCKVTSMNRTTVTCTTPAVAAGVASVVVTSNTVNYPPQQYTYDTALTPTVTSVSPTSGNSGDSITIIGTGFGTELGVVSVSVDAAVCSVSSVTDTSIGCTLGDHSAGTFDLSINVAPKGLASGSVQFTYEIAVDAVNPARGSFGGDQLIQVTGRGFDQEETMLTVCGEPCTIVGTPSATAAACRTPLKSGSGSQACAVEASVRQASDTLSDGFTFDDSLTPVIADVTPRRGGTGGGTRITISGSGFGTNAANANVTIAGSECMISTITNSEIVCVTEPRKPSIKAKVRVEIDGNGIAKQDNADYEYIDLWSSRFSWGGGPLPEEGDFVVIPADMTMVLDVDTPVLKMILIQGGKLIFDEKDVELKAENILIVAGGLLQVGTEENPFQHKAIITMHGHVRSKEMPIYGTKVIAVRNGTLDLHGKPVGRTWTRLDGTASVGSNTITLQDDVSWQVGDVIAIASTGTRHSQRENEKKTISSISGRTLTLDSPLEYEHLGVTLPISGGHSIEARAEVGLISRNVVVRGSDSKEWHDYIEACKKGFDTGEFATQTCFQGRFGEEIGSDQFGAQILIHAPRPSEQLVTGRLENVELTYVGQAFRLGRYAIHFHLNGDMPGSYVRGCSAHQSFNRFVNIHGTNHIMVEHNVIYNIMGGAFFFEDGVEIGNTFQYNLAIFVKSSTSLQNDDITPAAFWVTNPNNTIQHNAAAGGTHFGFWYRMHEHPDGPSFDPNICPRKVPLARFFNNSVHSQGWFGIWIFQHYTPMVGGLCSSNTPTPARFYNLTTWNCEKGAESVGTGSVQFIDFTLVNNQLTGFEWKLLEKNALYSDDGPMLKGGVVASGISGLNNQASNSAKGVILPYGRGMRVKDILFVNYATSAQSVFGLTSIQGKTEDDNGGFYYELMNLMFDNCPNKVFWRWPHEAVLVDMDGSFTGIAGSKAVPATGTNPSSCVSNAEHSINSAVPGVVCPADVKFYRYSWNNPLPTSLLYRDVTFTNRFGSTRAIWRDKRVTHAKGWMVLLVDKETTTKAWNDSRHLTNITYYGRVYDFMTPQDHVLIKHEFTQSPDWFTVTPQRRNESSVPLSVAASKSGDWKFNTDSKEFTYILSNHDAKNPDGLNTRVDRDVQLKVYRCLFSDCIVPPDPDTVPPPAERPDWAVTWSDKDTWKDAEDGWGGNYGNGEYGPPRANKDIKIREGTWVVADMSLPVVNKLYIYGTLELEYKPDANGNYYDFTLNCSHIIIIGGRLIVGWENRPFHGNANIVLRGDHDSEDMPLPGGPNIGAKAIGNFGGLDMHGISKGVSWTTLSETAAAGSSSIVVSVEVGDWNTGDEILISTTGYNSRETELRKIQNARKMEGKTELTLDRPLQFTHKVVSLTLDGESYTMAAKVGVLTRTVKIIGDDYPKLYEQAFGARVLTSTWVDGTKQYTGWARLSNVEFKHTGQEGWTDFYDPRYSLAFLDVGEVTEIRPSYVKNCAFNYGFSPAIGIYGTNNLTVESNIIYHTIGSSVFVWGQRNTIKSNLVTRVLFPGTWNGRVEERLQFDAGFELQEGADLQVVGNVVAGSERAGFRTDGQSCDLLQDSTAQLFKNNEVHSSLIGVMVLEDGITPCSVLNGFTVWKNWFYGIYFQSEASYIVQVCTFLENQVGLFPQVFRPPSSSHAAADKFVELKDSTFIGISSTFNCSDKLDKAKDKSLELADTAKSWDMSVAPNSKGGVIGLAFASFVSGFNGAPKKPFNGITSYQAIKGHMTISGVTFANFGSSCSGNRDYVISTGENNEDAQHPISIERIKLIDVENDNKIFNHRPDVNKINPSDCVDMDCDAKKKALVMDKDGTFLGSKGAIISESEWEWGGDPRRGLGDYRIPKTLLSTIDGKRINVTDICPNKGIVRNPRCELKSNYQAWWCPDSVYRMMMLESLDEDTETRRVSPVAVLGQGGYIDLINGPQDHGWCMGYTCQERLSTFPLVLATGLNYTVHYTGTTPQDSRMYLLNAEEEDAVVMAIWYAQPWRLDIYVNDIYRLPKNGYFNDQGQLIYREETTPGEYLPDVTKDSTGSSYFDRDTQMLHVLVRGSIPVTIKTNPLIFVSTEVPFQTVDEFFGERIVENLAKFFNIPKERIRVAEAVREDSRRRRRNTDTMTFRIEITNPPSSTINVASNGDLSKQEFDDMAAKIVNLYQLDKTTLEEYLNITLVSLKVTEPPPPTNSEQWKEVASVVHDSQSEAADSFKPPALQVPTEMHIAREPTLLHEGTAFTVQPAIGFNGPDGQGVSQLGSVMTPWIVKASLVYLGEGSDSRATLLGETTAPFSGSAATFSNLAISHSGRYAINFTIHAPEEASFFNIQTTEITVPVRPLSGRIPDVQESLTSNQESQVMAELMDAVTKERIQNIAWKGHSWTCTATKTRENIYSGSITGLSSVLIDPETGYANFTDVVFASSGRAALAFTCNTSPTEYDISFVGVVTIYEAGYKKPEAEVTKVVKLKFSGDYQSVAFGEEPYIEVALYNYVWRTYENISIGDFNITEGSILAAFRLSGKEADVEKTLNALWEDIKGPLEIDFGGSEPLVSVQEMWVDGEPFYGVDLKPGGLSPGAMAGIGVAVGLVLLAIIAVVLFLNVKAKKRNAKQAELDKYELEKQKWMTTPPDTARPQSTKSTARESDMKLCWDSETPTSPVILGQAPSATNTYRPPTSSSTNSQRVRSGLGARPLSAGNRNKVHPNGDDGCVRPQP